jgi:hypothetical protein
VPTRCSTRRSLEKSPFGAIRDGGIYIPVRGWGDKPAERGIKIKPMMVSDVLERTEWLELLRNMVTAGEIKLRALLRNSRPRKPQMHSAHSWPVASADGQ